MGENAPIHALELFRKTFATGNLRLDSVSDAIQNELLTCLLNLPGAVT